MEWPLSPPNNPLDIVILFPCDFGFGEFGDSSAREKNPFVREHWKLRLSSNHFGIPCISELIGIGKGQCSWAEYPDYQELGSFFTMRTMRTLKLREFTSFIS